jgi:tetratricopeptide (TPR) repeat protein
MALKLNPNNPEVYNNRANAYYVLRKYDMALADYDAALKLDPKNARIYANRGLANLGAGKNDDAEKDFAKSFELDPTLKQKLENDIRTKGIVK